MTTSPIFRSPFLNAAFQAKPNAFSSPFTAIDFQVATEFLVPSLPSDADLLELQQLKKSMIGAAPISKIEILDFENNQLALDVLCASGLSSLPLKSFTVRGADDVDLSKLSTWKAAIENVSLYYLNHMSQPNTALPGETLTCKIDNLAGAWSFKDFATASRVDLSIKNCRDPKASLVLPPAIRTLAVNQIAASMICSDTSELAHPTLETIEIAAILSIASRPPNSLQFPKVLSIQTSGDVNLADLATSFPNLASLRLKKAKISSGSPAIRTNLKNIDADSCHWHELAQNISDQLDQVTDLSLSSRFIVRDLVAILRRLPSLKNLFLQGSWSKDDVNQILKEIPSPLFTIQLGLVNFNDYQRLEIYKNGVWTIEESGSRW